MKKPRTHTFGNVKYDLDLYAPRDGSCDPPSGLVRPAITLPLGLRYTRRDCIVLIHEALHACNWDKDEEKVEQTAEDLGGLVWKFMEWRQ